MSTMPLSWLEEKQNLDGMKVSDAINPWKEVEGTVRTVDESKVKDCTDDIDTLLVFAGLYSAVLTAFLIESYKNLFADESESLLRQIASQTANYRFSNGYLNSTFDPSKLPTFKAAVSDIRVNVCWFASLVLSLSSASFGILVKQWLREFLAIDYINPQERLRIRDARVRGLSEWKLFEIAALLPIILQISLALFFVGLCFFTAAVHQSIGITSITLVSCWAFLFCMSVIAPLFSPRCPYRMTVLKVPFQYARPHVRHFLRSIYSNSARVLVVHHHGKTPVRQDSKTSTGVERTVDEYHCYDDHMNLQVLQRLSSYVSDEHMFLEEEDKLRSQDDRDLAIFHEIDSAFFDDSLLVNMQEALTQQPPPLLAVLRFVATVVDYRLGFSLSNRTRVTEYDRRREPWPWTLSRRARVILVNLLTESMVYELDHRSSLTREKWMKYSREDSEWSAAFISISLLSSIEMLPKSVLSLFQKFSSGTGPFEVFLYQMRIISQYDPEWPARSLLFLAQYLKTLKAEDAESTLRHVAHVVFLDRTESLTVRTYGRLLRIAEGESAGEQGRIIAPTPQTIIALLEVARMILHNYILEQTQAQDQFPEDIGDLLEFVLDALPKAKTFVPGVNFGTSYIPASEGPCLNQLLVDLFASPATTSSLLNFLSKRSHLIAPEHPSVIVSLLKKVTDRSKDDDIAILNACTTFFMGQPAAYRPNSLTSTDHPVLVLLRLCRLVWSLYTFTDIGIVACWERLFAAVLSCYEGITEDRRARFSGRFVCRYSATNEHSATCEAAYAILSWVTVFRRVRFTNEMIKFFRSFVCTAHTADKRGNKLWSLQHLEELEKRTTAVSTTNSPLRSPLEEPEISPKGAKPFRPRPSNNIPATFIDVSGMDIGAYSQLSPDASEVSRHTASPQQETASRSSVSQSLPPLADHDIVEPEGQVSAQSETPAVHVTTEFENDAAVEGIRGDVRAATPRSRLSIQEHTNDDRNPLRITKEGIPSLSDPHSRASILLDADDMVDAETSNAAEDNLLSMLAISRVLALSDNVNDEERSIREDSVRLTLPETCGFASIVPGVPTSPSDVEHFDRHLDKQKASNVD